MLLRALKALPTFPGEFSLAYQYFEIKFLRAGTEYFLSLHLRYHVGKMPESSIQYFLKLTFLKHLSCAYSCTKPHLIVPKMQ